MLVIRTLGEVTIELQNIALVGVVAANPDRPRVHFATRAVDALLIYLACQQRPLGRDVLAELLWPERTQKQARSNLRVALHRLRQQIAPYLQVTQHNLAINPEAATSLDAAQFETDLTAGRLAEAVALYRGDFLDGFYLDGSPTFEQWALLERERLRTLALSAYQQLIDQSAVAGQLAVATSTAQRLLQLDPLHEPTHRQLMRLLAQTGQRSAALAQYETCRQLLTAELDVLPDEATMVLVEQIRAGNLRSTTVDLRNHPVDEPILVNRKSEIVNRHNLPSQPTPFIGRSAELAQIAQLLTNPDCRLLTLLGVGGIGKTRLALEAAARQMDTFADGVCFVALAPVEAVELVTVTMAQSLGLQTNSDDLLAAIAAYLRPRHLLLVLDNFEHLLPSADLITHLLQQAPRLKVLVTSRERLYLCEEWLLSIAGLSFSGDMVATGLAGEAEQLFLHSAQRVQPGFLGQGQGAAIVTVCRQVEGLPLALELAASWVRVMPCDEIARQLQANFDFLTSAVRNLPDRHRSMRALFDHSWRLLSPVEQGVLMRLSVFRGGWHMAEAVPVTGATLALLLGLVDKSLVRTNGQQRFDLHELVRQYAAEQLMSSGEGAEIRQRHYTAYLQLFRTADSHLRGPDAAAWVMRLEAEQDNLRAAMQWVLDEARYADAAWLIVAANWFWEHRGFYAEARRWFAHLLPHRQMLAPDLRLAILISHNAFAIRLETAQPIDRYWDEIMALQEITSISILRAAAWFFFTWHAADSSQAAAALEQTIAFARAAGAAPALGPEFGLFTDWVFILGTALRVYADCLIHLGKLTTAAAFARESVQLCQSHGNRFERVGGLGVLGTLALLQGDLVQARQHLQEVVNIATAVKEQESLSDWQPLLGLILLYSGDAPEAGRLLHESLRLCLSMKAYVIAAPVCTYLAETALWSGDLAEAAQWLAQSLRYYPNPRRITIHEVGRLWVAARLTTAQQDYRRAAMLFGLADQMHSQVHHVIAGPMRDLAEAALATVRAALEPAVFAEAFAAGQQMSLEEAFATILRPVQP
ncbi:MAG: BTAD domain-containing putative transcriptional regulator [Caldilineaceae bacterium]